LAEHSSVDLMPVPAPIVIRKAREDDALVLVQLLGMVGYESTLGQIAERIAATESYAGSVVMVAEVGGQVAGVLSFHCIPLFHAEGFLGRITSLMVSQAFRSRGVGRELVAAAEEFGWQNHCARIEVTCGDHSEEAHVFCNHLGYKVDGRRFIKQAPSKE
jgi:GNAT superfamily N-acetyltransferase